MKTAIVVDSGSNYYNEQLNLQDVFAIPLQIIDGNEVYQESIDISIDEVNQLMKQEKSLKTSLPSIGLIEELFQKIKELGYQQILAVPITSGISGTINAMLTSAQNVGIEIYTIDCYTTMHIQLYIALEAKKMLDQGLSIEKIIPKLQDTIFHSNTFIIPDNLDHLSRSGRLSPLAAKLGGLLKIKPILYLNHDTKGIIEALSKVRTMKRAINTVIDEMKKEGVDENYRITVTDVESLELANEVIMNLKEEFPKTEILYRPLISTVSAHVGLGSIALQFYKKI